MAEFDDIINFKTLEKELQTSIEKDKLYWQQNDAKFRAVADHRVTYDQFRLVNVFILVGLFSSLALLLYILVLGYLEFFLC